MSEPLPDITIPTATSRFNPGGGFSGTWFPALAASIRVLAVETLNRAKAAIGPELTTRGVPESGDPRLVSLGDDPSIIYATVDAKNRRTWLEVGVDGGPTEHAGRKIGASRAVVEPVAKAVGVGTFDVSASDLAFAMIDNAGRRLEFELGADGRVTPRVLAAWAARMGNVSGSTALDHPTDDWAHWGDSMTASGFPAILAGLTGRAHFNGGWAGQTTTQIAARQGGTPALVTLDGNQVPGQGPVAVSKISNAPTSASSSVSGAVSGVPGVLSQNGSGGFTFTRTSAGSVAPAPAGTPFLAVDGASYRDRVVTIWAGRNGVQYSESPQLITARIRSMLDYLTPRVRRAIVMQIAPNDTEGAGTSGRALVDAANSVLAQTFPTEYLAIADYLRTPAAATAAGIAFTADDHTDIANKVTPRSFRLPGDNLHLNTAGNTAVAKRVYAEAQNKGWI